jgi:Multiubiquitin
MREEILDCNDQVAPGHEPNTYQIQFALGDLNFRTLKLADPMPQGRQILVAAGIDVRSDSGLFAILPTGDFEDIRLDETFDLRGRGAEKFVAFQTDRDYKLTLDDRQITWGKPAIKGSELYNLANTSNDLAVFVEVRGGEDKLVSPEEAIDLTAPGIEHFITAPRPTHEIEIIVNSRSRLVPGPSVTFEQIVELAYPGSHNPNYVFTISYRKASSMPPEGSLSAGQSVKIKTGTILNVSPTDKS